MQYFRPTGLAEAVDWLAQNDARVAAGCTDLFPATAGPALSGPLLDITAIPEMRAIEETDAGWRFGAAATWTDILRADLPAAFDGLKQAAREVGSRQIQNAGTIGGNLCHASPAADGVPCLLTLDAGVELVSRGGTRELSLASFIIGPRETALQPDEILSAVVIPKSAGDGRAAFVKLGARKYLVISIAMVAARLTEKRGRIETAAVAVGACSSVAVRLGTVEAALVGQSFVSEAAARVSDAMVAGPLSPIDDARADAVYRSRAAGELVRRVLREVLG